MDVLNLTVGNLTFVQTGKGGSSVTARLPSGALLRFPPTGKNQFRVAVQGTDCQSRRFNDADALVVIVNVEPCNILIYRLWDGTDDRGQEEA